MKFEFKNFLYDNSIEKCTADIVEIASSKKHGFPGFEDILRKLQQLYPGTLKADGTSTQIVLPDGRIVVIRYRGASDRGFGTGFSLKENMVVFAINKAENSQEMYRAIKVALSDISEYGSWNLGKEKFDSLSRGPFTEGECIEYILNEVKNG